MLHGSAPNHSFRNRTAQFLRAFPKAKIHPDRLQRRSRVIEEQLTNNGITLDSLGISGREALGL